VALRIAGRGRNELGNPLFAHTSAVYIGVAGKSRFKPEAARLVIDDLRAASAIIEEKAVFTSAAARDKVLEPYSSSIRELERRLEAAVPVARRAGAR
jgi:hypothetical protein